MTESGAEFSLRTYLAIFRQRKWWVLGIALIGLSGSLAFSLVQQKQYSATAQILVQPSGGTVAIGSAQQPVTPTDVQTEMQLVTSAPVQKRVRHQLGSEPDVAASQIGQTNIIAITATSPFPARAAVIANTYAKAFVSYCQAVATTNLANAEAQLRTQISSIQDQLKPLHKGTNANSVSEVTALLNQEAVIKEQLAQMQVTGAIATSEVELVTPAQIPVSPSSPSAVRNSLLGLSAGLILGIAAAFLCDNLDDTLTSKETTEEAAGSLVLAMVPMVPSWRKRNQPVVVSTSEPASPGAEAFRSLRTSLQFARQERQVRSLVVTSPAASEGKSSTLANLGVVFAQAGERVVLVSCDLRRPRLGDFFGLSEHAGFTSILLGQQSVKEALRPVPGHERLWILPAGEIPHNPAEMLNGADTQEIFATLRASFDLVLIDSPPVLPVTDAVVLSKQADAVLMVVAAGQTRRGDLQRAAEKLRQVNAALLGAVLNEVTKQSGYGYGYGYSHGSYVTRVPATSPAPHPNGKPVSPASPDAR